MKRLLFILAILALCSVSLNAQNTLALNGLNEAQFIYRTVADSLNVYFRDAFAFNLGYRNFGFGMKFIAELPKYSTSQSDLMGELDPARLDVAWKEMYVNYEKGAFLIHAGTLEETFGTGLFFRSYEDVEFDQDHRSNGFKLRYDERLRLKALYGAMASSINPNVLDINYGADAEYPLFSYLTLGASAMASRNLTPFNNYSQTDLFGGRASLNMGPLSLYGEYSTRELYRRGNPALKTVNGSAIYATADFNASFFQAGAAYKKYDQFQFRQQDIPLVNHHSETLADNQASGADEEGMQGWLYIYPLDSWTITLDYAEAWNAAKSKEMNDFYASLDWAGNARIFSISWSQIEKTGSDPNALGQEIHYWQKQSYPALKVAFPLGGKPLTLSGEFHIYDKETFDANAGAYHLKSHYEPKLQADFPFRKFSLSVGGQSYWKDMSAMMDSRYWLNAEARIPLFDHSDLVLFAGKEAGGKVCRNGVCRYVAPFSGLRAELSTRF